MPDVPRQLRKRKKWRRYWRKPWTVPTARSRAVLYKRKLRQMGHLSTNFRSGEFTSKASCGCAPPSKPLRREKRTQKLAFKLERVRHKIGDRSIGVLSGERTPCHNACVGGASQSRHMVGDAIDPLNSAGVSWAIWNRAFQQVFSNGGIGVGCISGNVAHVDLGPKRRWCYAGR